MDDWQDEARYQYVPKYDYRNQTEEHDLDPDEQWCSDRLKEASMDIKKNNLGIKAAAKKYKVRQKDLRLYYNEIFQEEMFEEQVVQPFTRKIIKKPPQQQPALYSSKNDYNAAEFFSSYSLENQNNMDFNNSDRNNTNQSKVGASKGSEVISQEYLSQVIKQQLNINNNGISKNTSNHSTTPPENSKVPKNNLNKSQSAEKLLGYSKQGRLQINLGNKVTCSPEYYMRQSYNADFDYCDDTQGDCFKNVTKQDGNDDTSKVQTNRLHNKVKNESKNSVKHSNSKFSPSYSNSFLRNNDVQSGLQYSAKELVYSNVESRNKNMGNQNSSFVSCRNENNSYKTELVNQIVDSCTDNCTNTTIGRNNVDNINDNHTNTTVGRNNGYKSNGNYNTSRKDFIYQNIDKNTNVGNGSKKQGLVYSQEDLVYSNSNINKYNNFQIQLATGDDGSPTDIKNNIVRNNTSITDHKNSSFRSVSKYDGQNNTSKSQEQDQGQDKFVFKRESQKPQQQRQGFDEFLEQLQLEGKDPNKQKEQKMSSHSNPKSKMKPFKPDLTMNK